MDDELNSINFFRSYYKAAQGFTEKQRLAFYDAIMKYWFDDKIPELSGTVETCFLLIEPSLSKSKAKARAGGKGGKSKSQANAKQNGSRNEFCFTRKR